MIIIAIVLFLFLPLLHLFDVIFPITHFKRFIIDVAFVVIVVNIEEKQIFEKEEGISFVLAMI